MWWYVAKGRDAIFGAPHGLRQGPKKGRFAVLTRRLIGAVSVVYWGCVDAGHATRSRFAPLKSSKRKSSMGLDVVPVLSPYGFAATGLRATVKPPELDGIPGFFVAVFSVFTQLDLGPVGRYNCPMESLGRTGRNSLEEHLHSGETEIARFDVGHGVILI